MEELQGKLSQCKKSLEDGPSFGVDDQWNLLCDIKPNFDDHRCGYW